MQITQIRNATQIITYAGKRFLIDPLLAPKDAYPGYAGCVRQEIRVPMVDLPFDISRIIDVDAVIVTHTHPDHWDDVAASVIPKDKLIFVQNEKDKAILSGQGFKNLQSFADNAYFGDIELIKTTCQHGTDLAYKDPVMGEMLGDASGVVFKHPQEKTIYLIGDSVWTKTIENNMNKYQPDILIMNTGWAHVLRYGPIIFGKEDVIKAHNVLPEAMIVATHMETVNHSLLTRAELMDYARINQIEDFVCAPADGETVEF